eukprot:jgi/Chlat1/5157/Chrsp33S05150
MAAVACAGAAVSLASSSSSSFSAAGLPALRQQSRQGRHSSRLGAATSSRRQAVAMSASGAPRPDQVIQPKRQPKLSVNIFGFTEAAEVLNSRAAMLGLIGIVIVEAIIGHGFLETVGITVGKGLDIAF